MRGHDLELAFGKDEGVYLWNSRRRQEAQSVRETSDSSECSHVRGSNSQNMKVSWKFYPALSEGRGKQETKESRMAISSPFGVS